MGVYSERVLPRLVDAACGSRQAAVLRRRVCAELTGAVVEIGFGSGRNVPFYPPAVTRVDAVEPSDTGWRLAGGRVRASSVPVLRSGLDGQALPYADAIFDAAVSTWTLCTIPDPYTALREVRRVLRPGAPCGSWSTASRPTRRCGAGSGGSNRSSAGWPAAAGSPARSRTC